MPDHVVQPPRVAILGGGMAGLTAAWRLTDPDVRDQVASVTVYQRGFRLGGKGASSRNADGRIEEHGLHIWLGYYDNAFRVMRECYEELDRAVARPDCPIQTWLDGFQPAPQIGLDDCHEASWSTWTAVFSTNEQLPGEPLDSTPVVTAVDMLRRSMRLVMDFYQSLEWGPDSRPEHRLATTAASGVVGVAAALENELRRLVPALPSLTPLLNLTDAVRSALMPLVAASPAALRLWQLLDVVTTQIKGMIRDDLMGRGFSSIDHLDYREWIASHGASRDTTESALVRGLYNLAFSHRGGDPHKTAFPAGLGLFLSLKTFFDFKGSIFWKMQAGMGDVVMAPLYEALQARGVRFEFFHRVEELHLSPDATSIASVELGRQVDLQEGLDQYNPLVDFDGLPCFPDKPDLTQLKADDGLLDHNLESFWCQLPDAGTVEIKRGRDFDEVILAIPVGMTQHLAGELIEADPRWDAMVSTMETVGTQAFQLWLIVDEETLGWSETGSTVTNYVDSYDTWASMSHLLPLENSSLPEPPRTIAYFCSSMAFEGPDDPNDPRQHIEARGRATAEALSYIESDLGHYWPGAYDDEGAFRWELLAGSEAKDRTAFDSQFLTANVDPSDRYVQALPHASAVRLRPDDAGFAGLHLAGDWTDCGLNAGCIEAAALSGVQAANSVLRLPREARITGGYPLEGALTSRIKHTGTGKTADLHD